MTDEYFTDAPPGCNPADSLRQGLFSGPDLIALAEMACGLPTPGATFLGLMVVAPAARGTGAGPTLLRHFEQAARNRACTRLYLSVLDANPRGHAFWTRLGFAHSGKSDPVSLGRKTQTAHRLFKPL